MCQCTNKLVSDSHGLVYFALGQVEFIHHLHNGQEEVLADVLGKFIHTRKNFGGLLKIISGLVHSAYSLKGKLENWLSLHPVICFID